MKMLPKDLDRKLFSSALEVINKMWGDEMDTLQQASLANQIVRNIAASGALDECLEVGQ